MALFESTIILLLIAVALLQVARWMNVPYATMLAVTGAAVAAVPGTPQVTIEPHLALALFIAPALLSAAFDQSPRDLVRNWRPLFSLAFIAVLLTTAVVAVIGWSLAGLPIAAAIALGAIVSPPDAAAAAAIFGKLDLPHRVLTILRGESLLNDASALLIFNAALAFAAATPESPVSLVPTLLISVPGGVIFGVLVARIYLRLAPFTAGTLGATILQFSTTFAVWLIAERLHLSAILAVVAYAMTLAHTAPRLARTRDRILAYSVWDAAVFILNVLAFMLMGLQARTIFERLPHSEFWNAVGFALLILAVIIIVRLVWVLTIRWLVARIDDGAQDFAVSSKRESVLIGWCGMRGLVTLATAFALPDNFPGRDLIVLTAFTVVIGTLVIQGLTVDFLIRKLGLAGDDTSVDVSRGRVLMLDAALRALDGKAGPSAEAVRHEYQAKRKIAQDPDDPQGVTEQDQLRLRAIAAQRKVLLDIRQKGEISDEAFYRLEEELDWAELDASAQDRLKIVEG
ncbi:cation:proton antiporter [Flaviflagellibacter deserti]|uniref:Cation:proton antiporter n=1 Tax=Flaviflagellibacter deserti TaxID=2267266 RepID=A0ABV9Z749_9HYPH